VSARSSATQLAAGAGALFWGTAARDPVRETTTAADPKRLGSRAAVLDERADTLYVRE